MTKEQKLALWKEVAKGSDQADWAGIAESADGMDIKKLKRHFKQVMMKEAEKFISAIA